MRVLVCGDREYKDKERIRRRLLELDPSNDVVIEGEAKGADELARDVAKELGIPVIPFRAEWEKFGRAAGPIRNQRMLEEGPGLVIAFHKNIAESKGTANCITQARKLGIPVEVVDD